MRADMIDKIKGSLIGGAAGDALGFPVEFLEDSSIFKRYGENGITEYKLYDGLASISDDTQMTLFTAEGIINAQRQYGVPTADEYVFEIYKSYLDWLKTQNESFDPLKKHTHSKLLNIEELYSHRAPGRTCLSALETGECGTFTHKLNNSKGCGGVMRIAPIPLRFAATDMSVEAIDILAARVAAITHSHELGYIPAAFVSHVITLVLRGEGLDGAVVSAQAAMRLLFKDSVHLGYFDELIRRAVELANDEDVDDDLGAINQIGEGWVAEETAAIAVYCALRHRDSFEDALVASVNHSGDSDSTGAVTGNIVGAMLGYSNIPDKFKEKLELSKTIIYFANELAKNK